MKSRQLANFIFTLQQKDNGNFALPVARAQVWCAGMTGGSPRNSSASALEHTGHGALTHQDRAPNTPTICIPCISSHPSRVIAGILLSRATFGVDGGTTARIEGDSARAGAGTPAGRHGRNFISVPNTGCNQKSRQSASQWACHPFAPASERRPVLSGSGRRV